MVDAPYPADLQGAAKAGTLKPNDDTWQNPSPYFAAGGIISTADDLATWIRALAGGKILNADYQHQWIESPEPEDPSNPKGQKYGYGIALIAFGPNKVYFHGGEMPGYNSFMGHDPVPSKRRLLAARRSKNARKETRSGTRYSPSSYLRTLAACPRIWKVSFNRPARDGSKRSQNHVETVESTRTTSSFGSKRALITIRFLSWAIFRHRCWRSILRMTNRIR